MSKVINTKSYYNKIFYDGTHLSCDVRLDKQTKYWQTFMSRYEELRQLTLRGVGTVNNFNIGTSFTDYLICHAGKDVALQYLKEILSSNWSPNNVKPLQKLGMLRECLNSFVQVQYITADFANNVLEAELNHIKQMADFIVEIDSNQA